MAWCCPPITPTLPPSLRSIICFSPQPIYIRDLFLDPHFSSTFSLSSTHDAPFYILFLTSIILIFPSLVLSLSGFSSLFAIHSDFLFSFNYFSWSGSLSLLVPPWTIHRRIESIHLPPEKVHICHIVITRWIFCAYYLYIIIPVVKSRILRQS